MIHAVIALQKLYHDNNVYAKEWQSIMLLTVLVSLWSSLSGTCGTLPTAGSCWGALESSQTPVDQVKSTSVLADTRAEKTPGSRLRCSGTRLYRWLKNTRRLRLERKYVPSRSGWWSDSCRAEPVRKTSPSALRRFGGVQRGTATSNCPVHLESSPGSKTSCLGCPFWSPVSRGFGAGGCSVLRLWRNFARLFHSTSWDTNSCLCRPSAAPVRAH